MSLAWQRVLGGISGCAAIGTSAYGAHGLKPSKEAYGKTYESGSRFHLLHSILLVATPSICGRKNVRMANVSGALLTVGMALFSGSCYAVAITEDRSVGKAAPVGGIALMAGWLSLALVRR
ncbi:Transmembrane protein 256 [Seminavis robusta]|uniref:Transmembrane protein 256 n=1 Tax=Seminavis robusta TaxID=568900 RepID=A0A9N8HI61_9STRA|nr:Transmembrane protein 256 [Seminavis robusta]CAB9524492.1 Transmembrane protein 256 [Seminavis robusta]|eukprot:Sro1544_g281220.1 Transmembrane protein 256 (121) ;mRNA; r:558-920